MSAEDIARAIVLMTTRAELYEGREWAWYASGENGGYPQQVRALGTPYLIAECYTDPDQTHPVAEHIAAWDPATTLVVADLLRLALDWLRLHPTSRPPWVQRAEAVAAQYLQGEP